MLKLFRMMGGFVNRGASFYSAGKGMSMQNSTRGMFLVFSFLVGQVACNPVPAKHEMPGLTPTLTINSTVISTFIPTAAAESSPTTIDQPFLQLQFPTAQVLASAGLDALPDEFSFGHYTWHVVEIGTGNRFWTRQDGNVNLEWINLYGGQYEGYMFVTRSEVAVGKSTLEIIADPRYPVFNLITGNVEDVDQFVRMTIARNMKSNEAGKTLQQIGSTFKVIIAGIEQWPLENNLETPQLITYLGLNGDLISQRMWGYIQDPGHGELIGWIGPFIETDEKTVQCAIFGNDIFFIDAARSVLGNPDTSYQILAAAISNCSQLDPESVILPARSDPDPTLIPKDLIFPEFFFSN
jgi:hypothetical protein